MSNSILNYNPSLNLTPDQRTAQALIVQQQNAMKAISAAGQNAINWIWSDPTKAQARFAVFQSLGVDPADLFQNSGIYEGAQSYVNAPREANGLLPIDASGHVVVAPGAPPVVIPAGWDYSIDPTTRVVTVIPPATAKQ